MLGQVPTGFVIVIAEQDTTAAATIDTVLIVTSLPEVANEKSAIAVVPFD